MLLENSICFRGDIRKLFLLSEAIQNALFADRSEQTLLTYLQHMTPFNNSWYELTMVRVVGTSG